MAKDFITIAASGTRSANFTSTDISNDYAIGVKVTIDVQSIASGSLVMTVQGKDRISSKYYDILATTAVLAATTKTLTIYPGIAAANNVSASDVLPYDWRVTVTAASGTAAYTIGATILS